MFEDLLSVKEPKISILTPSLNLERFLVDTIESILNQSYRNFEHIVVDGGSTDNTIGILKKYPHIRWISEKDDSIVQAYRKGLNMAKGEYIMQCCVSDGYLNKDWFKLCVDTLDSNNEISLVWGLPQYKLEYGYLNKISYYHFLDDPPPQKEEFLAYWLGTAFWYPEGNYCVRREVYDICYPKDDPQGPFWNGDCLGFVYNFNTLGYLPYYLPVIANYSTTHEDSKGKRVFDIEMPVFKKYKTYVKHYRKELLKGKIKHFFRNGKSEIIRELKSEQLFQYRKNIWKYRIIQSRLMRYDIYTVQNKICLKLNEYFK